MSRLIAFIIGSGANIGQHTAAALKAQGYHVAVGSRTPALAQATKDGYFPVAVDATRPESIKAAFAKINQELGPPNVVIFNGKITAMDPGTLVVPPVPDDPLTLPLDAFAQHADVGLPVFAAAQEAVQGFRAAINTGALRTFIVTGNPLPWVPADNSVTIGLNIQKLTEWRLMALFASAYAKENIRGPQHAKVYSDLVSRGDQADWDYRFTLKGEQWKKD
ncbi:hypothetical protein DFH07DRAFT_870571 [Mycena maculata]|uniref:NAD(P)-binding protein n=1 Tax=Mycena maculata TaxID=230809 RepID=A0AAD7I978_9AGAR|nr:hypothetical protein DFH07DRAFT_870571 [Mycena maculata]